MSVDLRSLDWSFPLADAASLAWAIHGEQVDKLGKPYMEHVLSVAAACAQFGPEYICVALLHDALEDAPPEKRFRVDLGLQHDFPCEVNHAVRALTFRLDDRYETRDAYYGRIVEAGDIAIKVKLADIGHNERRLHLIEDGELRERLNRKYTHAWEVLSAAA